MVKCMANYNNWHEKLHFNNGKVYLKWSILSTWLLLWPEVEDLEAGVCGEAGAELGEALLVLAHAVPLEVEAGEAGAESEEVAQHHHAAAAHVVAAEVESLDARAPDYSLFSEKINRKLITLTQNSIHFTILNF